ncbi:SICAvar, type I [Plasmodium knowlesi strain H]|uniref:SICAvar, type I n=3 Tax=Plasmodium knowlesi TaxID=5850 RepID=A0A5E7WY05_PLAKH|nr:SICAvar, type I [Plasmodium knowlesi strain H]OTN65897.1 SICAvar type I [Plasmodium knowlesi]CAA9987954.1 SICAvar, type I [Plasmodium knowlesi strain H]SBO22167.1 SICAvar, type I [Plasmodium knowlesi strain H]SBO29188.1 SICAvar, type I [Plasmodium knowlesi strain H]VVS77428.1 SICAvar, type I [Plasmodium knowlesi strain H]
MKDKNNTFCKRLQCAEQYWQLTDGKGSTNTDFWSNNVEKKLGELITNTVDNGDTGGAKCNDDKLDSANKAACEHMAKLLNAMYKNSNSDPNKYSAQIINCLLLKAYAEELKKKAKGGGFCSIDEGINHAFTQSKTIMESAADQCTASNTNNCFECNWMDNTKDGINGCSISNGTTSDDVKEKVNKLFEGKDKTKDDAIQKTLINFNKENKLCEWVNCAAKRSEENKNKGQGTTGQKDFWKVDDGAVKTLWTELSTAMEQSKGAGEEKCNKMGDNASARDATHSERKACNYLHAGLKKLYDGPTMTGDDDILSKKYPSFRQAVGCFLLHSYANEMKKNAVCEIDAGISKAFNSWQDLSEKVPGTCSGNGKTCIPCKWEENDKLKDCKIKADGSPSQDSNVEDKLKTIVHGNDNDIKTMAKEVNNVTELCDQVQCVAARWNKHNRKGRDRVPRNWDKVWEAVPNEVTSLGDGLKEATTENKRTEFEKYCSGLTGHNGKEADKDACILIAAGLKNLYDIPDNGTNDAVTASFQRTMRCFLLNAIADKLEALPCEEERSVKEGITKAFVENNESIKGGSIGCKDDNVKCFKCPRVPLKDLATCTIGENSQKKYVKTEVEEKLKTDSNLKDESLIKTICKPCDTGEFCNRLQCVADKWGKRKNGGSTGTASVTWNDMKSDFETELESLLGDMTTKQDKVAHHCNGGGGGWDDKDAHGKANKTACLLTAAGLHHISNIQLNYDAGNQNNPYDNQEFRQFASCLMLKAVVQKMKEDSKICHIDQGIRVAFLKAKDIKEDHCKNKKPCIECKLTEEFDNCPIDSGKKNDTVKPTLESLLKTKENDVNNTLSTITTTEGNTGSLCQRLQCLASRVQMARGNNNADDFWGKEGGEVAKLWKELSQAMTDNGGQDKGGQCGTMDDGSSTNSTREPTNPERRACQYLTSGFEKLKELTSPTATNINGNNILDKDPSLKRTIGCFLLHSYAKHMKEKAKCLVGFGIKKAFDTAGKELNGGQCTLDDTYGSCEIHTNGSPTKVTAKLAQVKGEIKTTVTDTLTKVNETKTLCDQLKCAAPKWFQNQMNGNTAPTKNWCDFWDTTVKDALEKMFKEIDQNGKDKSKTKKNVVCNKFGDDNPDSVERKACNHITAGLDYINKIEGNDNDKQKKADDKFFKQTMMCAALNLYADRIKKETEKSCPLDEERIKEMFEKWNVIKKASCSTSGGNDCFICERKENFSGCDLLVDKDLIGSSSSGGSSPCNNNDKEDVPKQMNELLNEDKSTINTKMNSTLTTITEMKSSFCTQLQCAAKKWKSAKNKITNGKASGQSTDVKWEEMKTEIESALTKLLGHMTEGQTKGDLAKYCNDDANWSKLGHKEKHTNKAACLLFASGLQHIYTHGNGQRVGPFKGPSFEQTMGCLFLKEYAKQLKNLANREKKYKVHPDCSVDSGINYAFEQSKDIMEIVLPQCKNNASINDCFVCTQNNDYNKCKIGDDDIGSKSKELLTGPKSKEHMQQTLENTVCPILITDLLTPFVPLAPVSIGLSAMAYYLWKYFGEGGPRLRRSPADIPGSSVQEQLLDRVEEAGSHEYRLVKERKPRSAPTRTKRSGRVNRRTIIEIHFEVLDECQKGDTQLNQKDFLELLVQEFMGSEFMEEEQVPKEDVLMERVPMEDTPMERVPILGSVFMV